VKKFAFFKKRFLIYIEVGRFKKVKKFAFFKKKVFNIYRSWKVGKLKDLKIGKWS